MTRTWLDAANELAEVLTQENAALKRLDFPAATALVRAKEAGLTKKPRVHDLRHTNASWLIQAGVPLTTVQRHMGHESIQTVGPERPKGREPGVERR